MPPLDLLLLGTARPRGPTLLWLLAVDLALGLPDWERRWLLWLVFPRHHLPLGLTVIGLWYTWLGPAQGWLPLGAVLLQSLGLWRLWSRGTSPSQPRYRSAWGWR